MVGEGGEMKVSDAINALKEAEELISQAAPLTWVGRTDYDSAALWEKKAYKWLQSLVGVLEKEGKE